MVEPVLQNALAHRDRLRDELARVEGFIERYKSFSRARREKPDGRQRRYASIIERALVQADKPMKREDMLAKLREAGECPSVADPVKYMGVIVWRCLRDKVERTPLGYRIILGDQR